MSDNLSHCMCGCIYEELECPNCNKVTDKDHIEELEAKLEKAIAALGYYAQDDDGGWMANKTLAELTGGKDE